jgi:hypothetical protein
MGRLYRVHAKLESNVCDERGESVSYCVLKRMFNYYIYIYESARR